MTWKGFKVKDYFARSNEHQIKTPLKFLFPVDEKDETHTIANITATTTNRGIKGWLEENPEWEDNIRQNMLTIAIDGYSGACFYQTDKFISTGHNNVIILKDMNMKKLCDENTYIYTWLAKMFTLIYKNKFRENFSRSLAKGNDFENEIFMMPITECDKVDEIFNVDDKSYTLDLETIQYMLNAVQEKHIKDIRDSYQTKLDYWQNELDKLINDEDIKNEIDNIIWKPYKVSDLFKRSNEHQIKTPLKFLITTQEKTDTNTVAVVTSSTVNNGITSWIAETDDIQDNIRQNMLTVAMDGYSGACFYQTDKFISTGHNNVIVITDLQLKDLCDKNQLGYLWLAKMFTLIYKNKFRDGFSRSLAKGNDFEKEIIMMPIFNDKFSINMMAYVYIKSKIQICTNKINKFNEKGLTEPFSVGKDE